MQCFLLCFSACAHPFSFFIPGAVSRYLPASHLSRALFKYPETSSDGVLRLGNLVPDFTCNSTQVRCNLASTPGAWLSPVLKGWNGKVRTV